MCEHTSINRFSNICPKVAVSYRRIVFCRVTSDMKLPKRIYAWLGSVLLSMTPLQVAAEVVPWKVVSNWDISFYDSVNGCLAYTSYEGGMSFFIGLINLDRDLVFEITLLNKTWKSIESEKEYTISARFRNETPWKLEMRGVETETLFGLTLNLAANSDEAGQIAEEFMREVSMDWTYDGKTLAYTTLRGSRVAFEEAVACAKSYRRAVQGSEDPFSTSPTRNSADPFAD